MDGDAVGWVIRMGLGVGMGRKLGSLELETCSAGLLLLDWTAGALRCAALRFAAPLPLQIWASWTGGTNWDWLGPRW